VQVVVDGKMNAVIDHCLSDLRGGIRDVRDVRNLPPVSTASQMRLDPLLDEWVMMASHRQTRTFFPPTHKCPLCLSTPARQTEIPSQDYTVAIFENRFPNLSTQAAPEQNGVSHPLVGFRPVRGGVLHQRSSGQVRGSDQ
jgi:UDPglucose--hexose-1-phosphate uridylyltransferase